MRLLLDTHFAIWLVTDPGKMPKRAHELILDPVNEVWGSVVSIWEVAIKHDKQGPGRLEGLMSGSRLWSLLQEAGLPLLPVTGDHAAAVDDLAPIHKDPFDRMLVAQAKREPMHLLTLDGTLPEYGDIVIKV